MEIREEDVTQHGKYFIEVVRDTDELLHGFYFYDECSQCIGPYESLTEAMISGMKYARDLSK